MLNLDNIDEIIEYLASDRDENGNVVSVQKDVIDWLTPQKEPMKQYIARMQRVGITGKDLISDYNFWERKFKKENQSFGNYVEYCEQRKKERLQYIKDFCEKAPADCNGIIQKEPR